MKKKRYEVPRTAADNWSKPLAWKRAGFKDIEDLKQTVRDLPVEEKLDLLTELFMDEMSLRYFRKKNEFLLKLGHQTWVDASEVLEYVHSTYGKDSRVDWIIDNSNFHGVWIDPRTLCFEPIYAHRLNEILDETGQRKRWDEKRKQKEEDEQHSS